jgi:hypothetical protein
MKIVIPKDFKYQFIFFISVFVTYFRNYELTFSVWTLGVFFTLNKKYSIEILKHVVCFVVIFLVAFLSLFKYKYQLYFIIRDITYLLKPILGLILGYQLLKKAGDKALILFVKTGFFIALYHIYSIFYGFIFYNVSNIAELRYYAGHFSDFEVYALVILVFHDKFSINFPKQKIILFTVIIGISSFAYLARTNFIQFFILIFAVKGFFKINARSISILTSVIILTAIGYSAILYSNPKRNGDGLEAFLYKIKVAPIEPFKTKINRNDWKDFNDNYRSYENIMTVRKTISEGWSSILFGQGLGSQIDLKQKLWLGDMELRYISILHNGFMTVLLKSGLVGVLLMIISIYLLFKQKKSQIPIVQNLNLLLIGSGIYMIISCWVFMGYYFAADTKSIIFGFIICYRELIIKKEINND